MIPCFIRKIIVAKHGLDFRRRFNGLLAESYRMGFDPYSGDFVLFIKKDRSQVRGIVGDKKGLYLLCRRFDGGCLSKKWGIIEGERPEELSRAELELVLEGSSFTITRKIADWKK